LQRFGGLEGEAIWANHVRPCLTSGVQVTAA
jgi:hypothetical protein